jgi:hypothetical protein
MANWEGYARSNYFKVKDEEKFRAWATGLNLEIYEEGGLFGIASEDGDWPDQRENEDTGESESIEIVDELVEHLQEGEIVVFQCTGHEKMRYLTGHSTAFNSKGERIDLDLNDIYDGAKRRFNVTEITLAQY